MTSPPRTVVAAALCLLAGCHRSSPAPSAGAERDPTAPSADAGAGGATVVPSRCRATPWSASLAAEGGSDELDLGDAVPFGDDVAVGIVHRVGGDRTAAVALIRPDGDTVVRVVDLGPTLGDEPPPRLAVSGPDLVAAFHSLPRATRAAEEPARTLLLRSIGADGSPATLFSVEEQRDDSLASDVAVADGRGLVVWDEATREPRGVIRAQPFAARQRTGAAVDLSPKDSDAETPRVVPMGKGFAVTWIARAPDPQAAPADGSDFEVAGEPRSRGWVEMAVVDEHGVPTGPSRRLTPAAGHVTAYDLRIASQPHAGGDAALPLLVVARDDGEPVDGSGGTLLRVRVGPDAAEPPVALPTDGLGRGAPTLVGGSATWLAWVGPGEQLRMMSLDTAGAPSGKPSAEDGLNDARPVLALPSGRLLIETPSDAARPLRTFACAP